MALPERSYRRLSDRAEPIAYVELALRRGEQSSQVGWAIYLPKEHVRCPCVWMEHGLPRRCAELLYILGPGHAAFVRVHPDFRSHRRLEPSKVRGRGTHRCPNPDCRQQLEVEEVLGNAFQAWASSA